jgi:uncharacterized protein (TIGR02996 family)
MSTGPPRPELLALLADCKEHPWQAGLRLILADWLEEHGTGLDQPRAELIRAQIEYDRLPADDPTRNPHGRRSRALQQRHGKDWLGPLGPRVTAWSCLRGLLSVSLTVPSLRSRGLAELASTEAWAWVEQVCIQGVQDEHIARLAKCPLLEGPTSVAFPLGALGPAGAQALGRSPWLGRMIHLDLSGQRLWSQGVYALLESQFLGKLRHLDLARVDLDARGGIHLAFSEVAGQLERLTLWGNALGDDGVMNLARFGKFTSLKVLDLRGSRIGDEGTRALADCRAMAGLRRLDLRDNLVGPAGARALVLSPYFREVESLVLWGNPVGADGARLLVERFGNCVHVSPVGS